MLLFFFDENTLIEVVRKIIIRRLCIGGWIRNGERERQKERAGVREEREEEKG